MQRIDLTPLDLKTYPFLDLKGVFWSVIMLITVALGCLYFSQLTSMEKYQILVAKQKMEKGTLLDEKSQFETILSRAEELSEKNKNLNKKIEALQDIISERILWSAVLKKITLLIPSEGIWLEKLSLIQERSSTEENVEIIKEEMTFSGSSFSNQKTSDFLTNLEKSLLFESLVLVFSQKNVIDGKTIYNFEIAGEVAK
jgi:Tfp pilus assembly protein PilN